MIKLTQEQKLWLYTRGERNSKDVMVDKDGRLYVLLSNKKKTYIPTNDKFIRQLLKQNILDKIEYRSGIKLNI